jgi:hypothetical protein
VVVDEAQQEWVVHRFQALFGAMRPPVAGVPLTRLDPFSAQPAPNPGD